MLCQTAIVYRRTVGDKVLSFGHEGTLYMRSFIMYDRETRSLWVHTTGEAVKGPLKGNVLTFVPSMVTTWKRWKALHPKTVVLTGQRGSRRMGYFGLTDKMDRYGVSVGQGKAPVLFPYTLVKKLRVINATVDQQSVVVYFDEGAQTARAFERGPRTFAWKDGRAVDQAGVAWDLLRGLSSEPVPERLTDVPATPWLMERWKAFHRGGRTWKAR